VESATPVSLCLFETPIGSCGLAWNERGVCRLLLPERPDQPGEEGAAATREVLQRRFPQGRFEEPTAAMAAAIAGLVQLLSGGRPDLSAVPLDLDGLPPFHQRVYRLAATLGPGETRTYGEVARLLGEPGAARAVGQALAKNPIPLLVPCHRVLAAGGGAGGFTAPGGLATKRRLLEIEGAALPPAQRELF
jgi:methylated-DNA-[protein]-cysteine S-methyltransferase